MKKIFSGSLILSFFILLISSPISHSAIKSGDVCKNLGSTTTLNSKRFVCVKIGKRFVWSRSTSVYKPTPSPTATPTPTPTQASTTVVSPENTLNSFSDLYDNYKSIPEVKCFPTAERIKTLTLLEYGLIFNSIHFSISANISKLIAFSFLG